MKDKFKQLIRSLEIAQVPEEESMALNNLAQLGESIVPELLSYASQSGFHSIKREMLLKVFQKIGYPANKLALPFIVSEVSNINALGWELALSILLNIGDPALPFVQDALQFYNQKCDYYSLEVQGLCRFLELLDSPNILSLLPELLYLLDAGTDQNCLTEYAIGPIKKIGSPKANSAIPLISKKIQQLKLEPLRTSLITALKSFDVSALQQLHQLLIDLSSDSSKIIRVSAKDILNTIQS